MRLNVLPGGRKLIFDAAQHAYSIEGLGVCRSVSGVLDRYFPFDTNAVADKVAAKEGTSRDAVIEKWSTRATLGSNVHAFIEQKVQRLPLPPRVSLNGEEHLYYPSADLASTAVCELYEPVAIELMIALPSARVAGTIDFLGRNRKTGGLLVGDWKTSGSFPTEFRLASYQSPCRDPISHLVNEKMSRYAMQTLLYGFMLENGGYLDSFQHPHGMPLEYGIISLGKRLDGSTGVEYKLIEPTDIVPKCSQGEMTADDIMREILDL